MADPETISYQTQQVTTEVFPSEMGEGEIPWWVWLLAALLGLLLLAIITLCLYKVSTTLESEQDFLIKLDMKPCGNKHFFIKSCNHQTYQNYEQSRQKLGQF